MGLRGAFLAGLALGRFFKASSRSSQQGRSRAAWQDEYPSTRTYAAGQPSGRQYPAPRGQDTQTAGQSGSTSNVSINQGETP